MRFQRKASTGLRFDRQWPSKKSFSNVQRQSLNFVASARLTVLALIAVVIAMFGAVTGGAFAVFVAGTSASSTATTGTVTIALGATGNPTNTLATNATGLAPGDTMQRTVDIINTGSIDWSTLTFTTTGSGTLLDTDTTNGLRLTVDECSVPWSGGPAPTPYTCSGTLTPRVTDRAVIGTDIPINGAALTAGATGRYRISLTLSPNAPNTMQNLSTTISYAFTANQRSATFR